MAKQKLDLEAMARRTIWIVQRAQNKIVKGVAVGEPTGKGGVRVLKDGAVETLYNGWSDTREGAVQLLRDRLVEERQKLLGKVAELEGLISSIVVVE